MNLMNYIKYENTCISCSSVFTSQGWMKPLCGDCLAKKQRENTQHVKDKNFKSYKVHLKEIINKHPQTGYGHCGKYKGLFCQSTWELAVAIWAMSENLSIKRSPLVIYYKFEGKQHRYHPDFEIEGKTYEIKGHVTPQALAKQQSAKEQGIDIVFIDSTACEFYFEYVYSKYGMDPRLNWETFYDKEITHKEVIELTDIPVGKRYPLHTILLETDPLKQKELILNSSFLFRDKELLARYIKRHENQDNPIIQHIEDLKKAFTILYS